MSFGSLIPLNSLIVEYVKDQKIAQKILEAVEVILLKTEEESDKVIKQRVEDKLSENKSILKDELKSELVTRELFDERFKVIEERFKVIDERFKTVDHRFDKLEFLLKILILVVILGMTLFNPVFLEIVRGFFGVL